MVTRAGETSDLAEIHETRSPFERILPGQMERVWEYCRYILRPNGPGMGWPWRDRARAASGGTRYNLIDGHIASCHTVETTPPPTTPEVLQFVMKKLISESLREV